MDKAVESDLKSAWRWIHHRCYNPKNKMNATYKARGIVICDEWLTDAGAFIEYVFETIGPRPEGKTLDRVDNDKGYEPGNLRWATRKEQQNNRSNTIRIDMGDGTTRPLKELCEERGAKYVTVYQRYKDQGARSLDELFDPIRKSTRTTENGRKCGHPPIMFHEKPVPAAKLAEMAGCSVYTIRYRWRKGLRDEALLTGKVAG